MLDKVCWLSDLECGQSLLPNSRSSLRNGMAVDRLVPKQDRYIVRILIVVDVLNHNLALLQTSLVRVIETCKVNHQSCNILELDHICIRMKNSKSKCVRPR